MAYTKAELSGPVQFGDDKKKFFYDASDVPDSLATVLTAGYFNNSDDEIRMEVDDMITVKTTQGQYELQVTASTGGAVSTELVGGDYPVESGTTSAALNGYGLSLLAGSATGNEKIYNLPGPSRIGQRKSLIAATATDHTVQSTGGYKFGTTGQDRLTLIGSATAQTMTCVELLAVTTTQYVIVASQIPSTGQITST